MDRKLKIAVFHCGFVYSGGGERIVLEEVKGLRRLGHAVSCFAPTLDPSLCYPDLIGEVGVRTLLPQMPKGFPLGDAVAMALTSLLAPALAFRFREFEVFLGANQPGAWIAFCMARMLRKPYVVYMNQPNRLLYPRVIDEETGWLTRRDYYVLNEAIQRLKRFVIWADRASFTGAKVLLANGAYIAGVIQKIYGREPGLCPAGCHPQPREALRLNSYTAYEGSFTVGETRISKPYVLITNRHEPQKKFEHVIEALTRICEAAPDASLIIPGPPTSHTPRLKALAGRLGISNKVHFLGQVTEQDLQRLYREATVYCYPSPEEDFGMGVIEAMAWGVPVVAWNWAGPTVTVVDGETGYLAQPYRVDDYAAAMLDLLLHREVRARMGRAARDRAEALFSWKQHVNILEKALWRAVAEMERQGEEAIQLDHSCLVPPIREPRMAEFEIEEQV